MALTPAVFLDKDGTVLKDVPYNADPDRMYFAPGAREGLCRLYGLGVPLIVVSNQPGIALGIFSMADLLVVHRRLDVMFREAGAVLTDFYYCPHHPKALDPRYAHTC